MATGLFTQIATQPQAPSEEEVREERELTKAFMEHSKKTMAEVITPALRRQINRARKEYANGQTITCRTPQEMQQFFDSL